jgi:hypothetical protein
MALDDGCRGETPAHASLQMADRSALGLDAT